MNAIFEEIRAERVRQDEKCGEQNYPSVRPTFKQYSQHGMEDLDRKYYPVKIAEWYGVHDSETARRQCEERSKYNFCAWADIATKEMSEVICSLNDEERRKELVQAAAVLVAWIECIDRSAAQ